MGEMQEKSDAQLLSAFAGGRDEAAFREIVTRYTDLVYSAALRQVESSAAAADIAQGVFTDLARKAGTLTRRGSAALPPSLVGWLHRATRYTALNHLRDTRRRLTNERQAMEQLLTNSESATGWEQIRPALDEALDSLNDEDREALLLRYFKNQDFRAVGLALGVSDDAAQKRVSRAVERLREFFSKRNVTIGASGLAVLISANAIQAAPVGLAITISAAALAGTAVATSTTAIAVTKTIAMTTLQKTIVTATVAILAGTGVYQAHQAAQLRESNTTLQQQHESLVEQIRQMQRERDDQSSQLTQLLAAQAPGRTASNQLEVLRLRGELARLQARAGDAREAGVKSWLAREDQLRQLTQQYPARTIPELQLLSDQQWLDAAMNAKFDTDKDIQQDLANLRHTAENNFVSVAENTLTKYLKASNGQFPTDLSQLQSYFAAPMDEAILNRW
ncbi:MAG TPA: sigma-70 family RNA polymerase sigma factor, partial [Opitutales bacterium]|nr:sigma-70 family RNA polymerase sigma factor [Opitutales bacterium]